MSPIITLSLGWGGAVFPETYGGSSCLRSHGGGSSPLSSFSVTSKVALLAIVFLRLWKCLFKERKKGILPVPLLCLWVQICTINRGRLDGWGPPGTEPFQPILPICRSRIEFVAGLLGPLRAEAARASPWRVRG